MVKYNLLYNVKNDKFVHTYLCMYVCMMYVYIEKCRLHVNLFLFVLKIHSILWQKIFKRQKKNITTTDVIKTSVISYKNIVQVFQTIDWWSNYLKIPKIPISFHLSISKFSNYAKLTVTVNTTFTVKKKEYNFRS